MIENRIFIAGAGPVGLTAAANLLRLGVPVTVFEAMPALNEESRASTFHPPSLDMLDALDVAKPLIARGLVVGQYEHRTKRDGVFARFDFSAIADATRHPYRLQVEQNQLTRILLDKLRPDRNFRIEFGASVEHVADEVDGVCVTVMARGALRELRGRYVIGADGAHSNVRRALGVEFEGFTWPERFLVISTAFPFDAAFDDLAPVSYFSDSDGWFFLLRIPGFWRAMFPISPDMPDDAATSDAHARACLGSVVSSAAEAKIEHVTLYKVHQRVAKSFRVGRVFLAGDAAHVNNPLGGMGMNGGIHDAFNVTARLAEVWHARAPEHTLDGYDAQRRGITIEVVQKQTIQNKRNLEAADEAGQRQFRADMAATAADKQAAYSHLLRVSMISSLRRAAELG